MGKTPEIVFKCVVEQMRLDVTAWEGVNKALLTVGGEGHTVGDGNRPALEAANDTSQGHRLAMTVHPVSRQEASTASSLSSEVTGHSGPHSG